MDARPATVEQMVPIRFAHNDYEPIMATFEYRWNDPYAVTAVFTTREGDCEWTFARDLLLRGLTVESGGGDVRVTPAPDGDVHLDLYSPEGSVRLTCDRTVITAFIDQVYASIPEGDETSYVQMDDWLAELCA